MENFKIVLDTKEPLSGLRLGGLLESLSISSFTLGLLIDHYNKFNKNGSIDIKNIQDIMWIEELLPYPFDMEQSEQLAKVLYEFPEKDLIFTSINTNSPMVLVGKCTAAAILGLTLAVMLSGGEADLKNYTFTVNSPERTIDAISRLMNTIDDGRYEDDPKPSPRSNKP